MRRPARLLLCIALVAGTVVAVPAGAAQRIGPVKYVRKVVKLLPGQSGTPFRVLCPEPYIVSGGGFLSDGLVVSSSGPVDASRDRDRRRDDGWRIVARNTSSGKGHVELFVACVKPGSAKHRYVSSAPVEVPAGSEGGASVDCPDGFSVTGGGLSFGDRSARIEWTSPMDGSDTDSDRDDGWAAEVRNESTVAKRLTVHAICQQGLTDTYVEASTNVPVGGQIVVAVCPDGTTAVGGGIDMSPSGFRTFVRGTMPYEFGDARSWASYGDRYAVPSGTIARIDTAVCRAV